MPSHRPDTVQREPWERGTPASEADEMAVQLELVRLADEELPLGVAYKRYLDLVHRTIAFDHGTLHVTEWGSGRLVPVAVRGNRIDLADEVRFARGRGLSAWVAQEGRAVVIPDPQARVDRSPFPDEGLRAFLAFPLVHDGLVAGVLALTRSERFFTPEEYARLTRLGAPLAACLCLLRRTARLRELVSRDPGPGARHRFLARVEEELQRVRQHGLAFTVAVLALDGAARGPWGADEVLTRRLTGAMRSCDLAIALGDGRWGLLLAGVGPERAASVVERITADVLRGTPLALRTGIATSADASSAEALIEKALSVLGA